MTQFLINVILDLLSEKSQQKKEKKSKKCQKMLTWSLESVIIKTCLWKAQENDLWKLSKMSIQKLGFTNIQTY